MTLKNLLDLYDNWNGNMVVNDRELDRYATVQMKYLDKWLSEHRRAAYARVLAFGFYDGELTVRVDL